MEEGYSTGLPKLDEDIGGGLPPGSLTVLTAPPTSAASLLGYSAALENSGVHILTTYRDPDRVRSELTAADRESDDAPVTGKSGAENQEDSTELRITQVDSSDLTSSTDATPPDWLSPAAEHQEATSTSAESDADSLSLLVFDSLSSVDTHGGHDAVVDTISALRSFADTHQTAVLVFLDETSPLSDGSRYAVRSADLLFTYSSAGQHSDTDAITIRRVRRAVDPEKVSDLPQSLPLKLSTEMEQNPDRGY